MEEYQNLKTECIIPNIRKFRNFECQPSPRRYYLTYLDKWIFLLRVIESRIWCARHQNDYRVLTIPLDWKWKLILKNLAFRVTDGGSEKGYATFLSIFQGRLFTSLYSATSIFFPGPNKLDNVFTFVKDKIKTFLGVPLFLHPLAKPSSLFYTVYIKQNLTITLHFWLYDIVQETRGFSSL